MAKLNIYTPDGVQDILRDPCYLKKKIENRLRGLFNSFSYREIETPAFEFADVFSLDNLNINQEKMFKIFDEKGRLLVLKPDQTIPVARLIATKFQQENPPYKVSYVQDTYRFNEQGGGRQRQFTQAGCELVGASGEYADAEMVTLAIKTLLDNGLEEFQIDIGEVGFFKGLMEEARLDEQDIESVRELIDMKDFLGLEQLLDRIEIEETIKEQILNLPTYFGDTDILEKLKASITNEKALKALGDLENIINVIKEYGYEKYVSIDLGMVKGLDYYTGIIFKGYTYGVGFPILSGGRYDRLYDNFGVSLEAVGFSVGVNFLMMALSRQKVENEKYSTDTFISYNKKSLALAYKLSDILRKQGLIVDFDLSPNGLESAKDKAKKNNIGGVIYVEDKAQIMVVDINKDKITETTLDALTGKKGE